jgi:hypothetical protein
MLKQYFCLAVKHSEFYLTLLLLRPETVVKLGIFVFPPPLSPSKGGKQITLNL